MTTSVVTESITGVINRLLSEFQARIEKRDASSLDFGVDAYLFAKSINNKELITKTCRALSQFYTDLRSEFAQSAQILEEGISLLDDRENAEDKAELLRLLGLNFDYLGALIKSKEAYDYSILLLKRKDALSDKGKLTMARSQFNLSIIYGRLQLPTLSEESLQSSYLQYKALNEKGGIARCYISFGVGIEEKNGSREEALEYYRKAAELSKEIGDDVSYCVAKGNMAVKLAESGKFEEGVAAAIDALDKATRSANKRFQLNLHRQIGRCYHLMKDYSNAKKWFAAGEKIFLELELTVDYYDLYRYWSEMLYDAGCYKESYEKLQKSIKQQEEMNQFHKDAAVSHATLRLQLEEGKREQELLKKKNAEIEQYARRLESSNFELKQFAHVASHDMKEPLRMISNYSQLLEKSMTESLSGEQKEYLNYLNEGAKRMMSVVNSMLRLSEIKSNKQQGSVDLNLVVNSALQTQTKGKKNAVQIKIDKLPSISVDKQLMEQLFGNIFSNSIKYNAFKQPRIEVKYILEDDMHRFEVSDNGIGIEKQYRDKVFIMFQRLHARHEYEGAGVGLTMCKKIIDSLSGKIWIEDSALGGIKICFTIPK